MRVRFLIIFIFGANFLMAQSLQLPSIFGDNMILQRNMQPPIWGKSKPLAEVFISIDNQNIKTKADGSGNWKTYLPVLNKDFAYTMTIKSGNDKIEIKNIAVGDVYYAGGQSNMQFELARSIGGEVEASKANFKNIRIFTVPRAISYKPKFDVNKKYKEKPWHAQWNSCSPETIKDFSGVAYYFGKKIHTEENVPVGLINVSWGGTPVEAHMSMEGNLSLPFLQNELIEIASKTDKDTIALNRKREVPQTPASIFNAMIHPLIPFGLKGIIWYQAEQNWAYPFRYREQFKMFIVDIRQRWQQGYLPFYFVQLPGMSKIPTEPMEDFFSVLRESQNEALKLPNVHVAVTLDLGESDVHPKNKKTPGERLADLALKYNYGKTNLSQCPVFESYAISRDTFEITFKYATQGLKFRNDSIKGISMAGDDHRFYWANAKIKGNILLVYCSKVSKPASVRYAWGEDPHICLFTKDGLPVSPFRTDNWLVREDGKW